VKGHLRSLGAWAIERLGERSTIVGIGMTLAACGHHLSSDTIDLLTFWGSILGPFLIALETKKDS